MRPHQDVAGKGLAAGLPNAAGHVILSPSTNAMPPQTAPQILRYVIPVVIIAIVLAFRLRGMRRTRRLRLETLWIAPALYALILGAAVYNAPSHDPLRWLWLVLAGGIGCVIGWQRGKLMRITVDPDTHALNQQASPAALLFILALIVVRRGLGYEAARFGIDVLKLTGIMLAFVFGVLVATRVEMFLRARRLLGEARAKGAPTA